MEIIIIIFRIAADLTTENDWFDIANIKHFNLVVFDCISQYNSLKLFQLFAKYNVNLGINIHSISDYFLEANGITNSLEDKIFIISEKHKSYDQAVRLITLQQIINDDQNH